MAQNLTDMTLHFQDRRGAALLRYRNRAKINVLMCEEKRYLVWFFVPAQKLSAVQFDASESDPMTWCIQ